MDRPDARDDGRLARLPLPEPAPANLVGTEAPPEESEREAARAHLSVIDAAAMDPVTPFEARLLPGAVASRSAFSLSLFAGLEAALAQAPSIPRERPRKEEPKPVEHGD